MDEVIKKAVEALEELDLALMMQFDIDEAKKVSDFIAELKRMDVWNSQAVSTKAIRFCFSTRQQRS